MSQETDLFRVVGTNDSVWPVLYTLYRFSTNVFAVHWTHFFNALFLEAIHTWRDARLGRSLPRNNDQVDSRVSSIGGQVKGYVWKNDRLQCARIALDRFLKLIS